MAGSTVAKVGEILRDTYLAPSSLVFELVKRWTCPLHKTPQYAEYEYVCPMPETCNDPYECWHSEERLVKPGCPYCLDAEYVPIEPLTIRARWRTSIEEMLSSTFVFDMGSKLPLSAAGDAAKEDEAA